MDEKLDKLKNDLLKKINDQCVNKYKPEFCQWKYEDFASENQRNYCSYIECRYHDQDQYDCTYNVRSWICNKCKKNLKKYNNAILKIKYEELQIELDIVKKKLKAFENG